MLTPEQAHDLLLERGHNRPLTGLDDPTETGLSYRWWWDSNGILRGAWWRGAWSRFDHLTLPPEATA